MDSRKRLSDRYVYLCDGVILICKMSKKGGGGSDLKLRDKHLIRRVDVLDREDLDDLKFTFELVPRDQVCRIVTVLGQPWPSLFRFFQRDWEYIEQIFFKNVPIPASFCLFSVFSNINFTEKTIGVSGIWTQIVDYADHLTTTTAHLAVFTNFTNTKSIVIRIVNMFCRLKAIKMLWKKQNG